MYDEKENAPKAQPEHLSVAVRMANEITENFEPSRQNEMLTQIRNIVKERRSILIEEAEKKAAYLKESYNLLS